MWCCLHPNVWLDVTDGNENGVHLEAPSMAHYRSLVGCDNDRHLHVPHWDLVLQITTWLSNKKWDPCKTCTWIWCARSAVKNSLYSLSIPRMTRCGSKVIWFAKTGLLNISSTTAFVLCQMRWMGQAVGQSSTVNVVHCHLGPLGKASSHPSNCSVDVNDGFGQVWN